MSVKTWRLREKVDWEIGALFVLLCDLCVASQTRESLSQDQRPGLLRGWWQSAGVCGGTMDIGSKPRTTATDIGTCSHVGH